MMKESPSRRFEADATIDDIEAKLDNSVYGLSALGDLDRNIFGIEGSVYYVDSARPDDTGDGTSWATAKKTIDAAVGLCSPGDGIFIAAGTYDETANNEIGVDVDVAGITIVGIGAVVVKNTDVTTFGQAILINNVANVRLINLIVDKGEAAAKLGSAIKISGAGATNNLVKNCILIARGTTTQFGIFITTDAQLNRIEDCWIHAEVSDAYGSSRGILIATHYNRVARCLMNLLDRAVEITGNYNTIEDCQISACTTGIYISFAIATRNTVIGGGIVNCTTDIDDMGTDNRFLIGSHVPNVVEATGTFSYDETVATEQEVVTLTIDARTRIGSIWLDMVNVTQSTDIRVYHAVDGTNLRLIDTYTWTAGVSSPGVLIDGFSAYRNVRITLQCGGGGAGGVNVPYSIV